MPNDAIPTTLCNARRIDYFKAEYALACKISQLIGENLYPESSMEREINLCAVKTFVETMVQNWR